MTVEHKGISVYFKDQGSGKPVVLLHGFLENSNMWIDLIPVISKNHRVIAIDLLGHGKTGCLGYIHSMELMAECVEAILTHLDIKQSVFIGHSMGGYVALAYAEKNPKALNGLCLMNSTFLADDKERQNLRTRANKMAKTNFETLVRMSFSNLFSLESKTKFQNELKSALNEALKTPLQGYIAASEGMKVRKDKSLLFKKLSCKKMVILGKKDPIMNVGLLEELLKNTDVELAILSEGHMSHIENKKELSYNLERFIEYSFRFDY
ncbi:MAG TPA: alpha/beta hydrolase [Xanthomarina sp.]|nr:alpha/beta hydrolase [Xanthomarina sp.]